MDILQAVKMCCRNCVRIYLQTLNLPISRSNLEVADFWESNFQYGEPNVQPDKNNSNEWIKIGWRSNYYIMGLSKDILDNNSWLGQTKGWTDQNGAAGTIDWQDDETLTID